MNPDEIISAASTSGPTHDEIALRAHQLWIEQGCPHGHDVENWLEAERQVLSDYANRRAELPTAEPSPNKIDLVPPSEDVPYKNFREEAPLATRVAEETIDPGRPPSPRSKTSIDL